MKEEEEEMFPTVKKHISREELDALGVRMKEAFDSAVEKGLDAFFQPSLHQMRHGGHNGAPVRPAARPMHHH